MFCFKTFNLFCTKSANPKVFFDIKIGAENAGRITFEVVFI